MNNPDDKYDAYRVSDGNANGMGGYVISFSDIDIKTIMENYSKLKENIIGKLNKSKSLFDYIQFYIENDVLRIFSLAKNHRLELQNIKEQLILILEKDYLNKTPSEIESMKKDSAARKLASYFQKHEKQEWEGFNDYFGIHRFFYQKTRKELFEKYKKIFSTPNGAILAVYGGGISGNTTMMLSVGFNTSFEAPNTYKTFKNLTSLGDLEQSVIIEKIFVLNDDFKTSSFTGITYNANASGIAPSTDPAALSPSPEALHLDGFWDINTPLNVKTPNSGLLATTDMGNNILSLTGADAKLDVFSYITTQDIENIEPVIQKTNNGVALNFLAKKTDDAPANDPFNFANINGEDLNSKSRIEAMKYILKTISRIHFDLNILNNFIFNQ